MQGQGTAMVDILQEMVAARGGLSTTPQLRSDVAAGTATASNVEFLLDVLSMGVSEGIIGCKLMDMLLNMVTGTKLDAAPGAH